MPNGPTLPKHITPAFVRTQRFRAAERSSFLTELRDKSDQALLEPRRYRPPGES